MNEAVRISWNSQTSSTIEFIFKIHEISSFYWFVAEPWWVNCGIGWGGWDSSLLGGFWTTYCRQFKNLRSGQLLVSEDIPIKMMEAKTIAFLRLGAVSFCYLLSVIVQNSIVIFYSSFLFFFQKKHSDLFSSFYRETSILYYYWYVNEKMKATQKILMKKNQFCLLCLKSSAARVCLCRTEIIESCRTK